MLTKKLYAIRTRMLAGSYDESLQALDVLMKACEAQHEYKLATECYAYMAMIHYNLAHYKKSFEMTNYYESLCSRYNVEVSEAHYYPLIGVQYMLQKQYNEALFYFERAATDASRIKDVILYSTSKKMVVTCLMNLQQWTAAEKVLHDMLKSEQLQQNKHTVEYAEWRIIQLALLDIQQADSSVRELAKKLLEHPILQHPDYVRTRAYFEETMVQFYTKRQQWQELYTQYENYIAYRIAHDGNTEHIDALYEAWVEVGKKISEEHHYDTLARYAFYLKQRQQSMMEDALLNTEAQTLVTLIHKDSLTGCYTRHYLEETVNEWLLEKKRLVLAVFDCDHFKQINDTYGHIVGDQVLQQLVAYITPHLTEDSFLARYGGDEFVLVTTHTKHCIDIFQAVQHKKVDTAADDISISISMGIVVQTAEQSFDALFSAADSMLYEAKRAGRGTYKMQLT